MKRHLYILLSGILLLSACVKEVLPTPTGPDTSDGDKVSLDISVDIPDVLSESVVGTKAFGEMSDEYRKNLTLCVYVFDNSGYFVERAEAYNLRHESGDLGFETSRRNQTTFSVELTKSKAPRKIHLVAVNTGGANYDDVVKKINGYTYGSEATIMRDLYVEGKVDAYWGRVQVSKIDDNTDDNDLVRIPLVRNFAKVTVVKQATLAPNSKPFELEGFCVFNTPDKGSVAPYNVSTGGFADFLKLDGSVETVKGYKEISALGYSGYMPTNVNWQVTETNATNSGDGGYTFIAPGENSPSYLYESTNAVEATKGKTYVIIKGKYNGSGTSSYYKVDVIYKDTEGYDGEIGVASFYNILRNFNFKIIIQGVTFEGYSSAKEAAQMPATNNISASVQAEGVNNVSDGSGRRLFVNRIYALYTSGGNKDGTLKCRFKINQDYHPENLKIRVLEGSDVFSTLPAIGSGGAPEDDYYIDLNFSLKDPEDIPQTAVLRVYVQESSDVEALYRDIEIVLRKPYRLKVDCTDVVPGIAGTGMNANLLIQDGMNKHLFPLSFLMEPEKKTLYPNASSAVKLPVHIGSSIVPGSTANNSFQYEREVTWEQYSSAETRTLDGVTYRVLKCDYKTNVADSKTTVYAKNEYCTGVPDGAAGTLASDSFKNGVPLFLDGDGAVATILPSDYYGIGNSFHYVTFTTRRTNAVVAITLEEKEGANTQPFTLNLNLNTLRDGNGNVVHGCSRTQDGDNYIFKVPFFTQTFKGSEYSVTVSYNTSLNTGATFEQDIKGAAVLARRYLYIPLATDGLAFETNIGSNNYNSEEYMKTGIGTLALNDEGTEVKLDGYNTGRVYFKAHGASTSLNHYGETVGFYARETDRADGGWQFPDGTIYVDNNSNKGYHIDLSRHSALDLNGDMYWCIYSPQSGANKLWATTVKISDITNAHAIDFRADVLAGTTTAHLDGGLDKMYIEFKSLP